jgi:hypothetical protein
MSAPAGIIEGSKLKAPVAERRLLRTYVLAIAMWGLDFRAAPGGVVAAFQGLLLIVYIACFLRIVGARRGPGVGPLWVLLAAALMFILDGSIVGLINAQPAYSIAVKLVPVSLYVATSILTYITLSIVRDNTQAFLDGLGLACIVAGIMHLLVISLERGPIDLSTSRYEVLSGAVVPGLGILAVALSQRLSKLDVLALLLNLAIALVSVTRLLVITVGVQVATVFIASPGIIFRRSALRGMAAISVVVLGIVGLDYAAGTGLTARWTERLFLAHKLGSDPSGLSRLAESHYMWDRFTSSVDTVVFGNGLAAVTSAVGRENARKSLLVGEDARNKELHSVGIGHQNYISILYVGGLLGGGGVLVMMLVNAIQSVTLISRLQRRPALYRDADAHVGIWGGLIVLGMLTGGFLAGTFDHRDECLWLGVGTGMLYWAREMLKTAAARTGTSTGK